MAENNFPNILKSFVIITLFISLLLSVVILFAGNYGVDTTDIDNRIGLQSVNNSINTVKDTTSGWFTTFETLDQKEKGIFQQILDIVGFLAIGLFQLLFRMFDFIITPFNIIQNIAINVMFVPAIFMQIVWSLIIISILFGIWRLMKQGR